MTSIEDGERLLVRIPEVAAMLGVGRTSVYELIGRGELPLVHVGRAARIPREAVRQWIERQVATSAMDFTCGNGEPDGRTRLVLARHVE